MATIQTPLLTVEEFCQLPRDAHPAELVRGVVAMMNMPSFRHGKICSRVNHLLWQFVEQHDLGHILGNDAGIVTQRDPDTVRGADVAFYSYIRLPKDAQPAVYAGVAPDLVFEVLSPGNRWSEILTKVAEYLQVGVRAVCVLDPDSSTAEVFRSEQAPQSFSAAQEFALPDVLPGWKLAVRQFFDV